MQDNENTGLKLRAGIETLEAIDREVDEINVRLKEVKDELKAAKSTRKATLSSVGFETGFLPKVIDQLISERAMDPFTRQQFGAQLQVGRATVGILDGTPLGEAARKAYDRAARGSDTRIDDPNQPPLPEVPDPPAGPAEPTAEDLTACHQEGRDAAQAGKRVADNPYPAEQPRKRAAWDEGWCYEKGSDGMDIPEDLRPKNPRKRSDDAEDKKAA